MSTPATDPAVVRALLARHLTPDGVDRLAGCRVVRSRVRSGRRAIVQYAVDVDGARPRHDLRVTVQWHADPLRAARHRRHARTAAGAVTGWTQPLPPAMFDDATGLLATTFPCDLRLPALPAIVGGHAAPLVDAMYRAARLTPSRVAGIAVDTVRYREQLSAVCRYTVRTPDADAAAVFYVKLVADDSGARAARRLDTLARATAGVPGAARVAPPVAWLPDLRALVLAAAPGVPLDVALANASATRRVALLRLVAAALARFGACTPDLDVHDARRDRAAATARALETIQRLLPGASALDALGTAIAGALPDDARGATHGDLKLEHVLVDGDAVWLIDLDSCHLGDPRWDLALLGARCDADRLREGVAPGAHWPALTEAYAAAGGPPVTSATMRGVRAAAWVDVAAGVLKRHEAGAETRAAALLDLARRGVTAA